MTIKMESWGYLIFLLFSTVILEAQGLHYEYGRVRKCETCKVWLAKNWKWAVPLGVVTVLGFCFFCVFYSKLKKDAIENQGRIGMWNSNASNLGNRTGLGGGAQIIVVNGVGYRIKPLNSVFPTTTTPFIIPNVIDTYRYPNPSFLVPVGEPETNLAGFATQQKMRFGNALELYQSELEKPPPSYEDVMKLR